MDFLPRVLRDLILEYSREPSRKEKLFFALFARYGNLTEDEVSAIRSYIDTVVANPSAFPHLHYVQYRKKGEAPMISKARDPSYFWIHHSSQREYLASYPDIPPHINLVGSKSEPFVQGQFFVCELFTLHLSVYRDEEYVLFFPEPFYLRVTFSAGQYIRVEKTGDADYDILDYHKIVQVPLSCVERFERLYQLQEERDRLLNAVFICEPLS